MKNNKTDLTCKLNSLKNEYNMLCFGAMVYGRNTEAKRKTISEEIERIENKIASM